MNDEAAARRAASLLQEATLLMSELTAAGLNSDALSPDFDKRKRLFQRRVSAFCRERKEMVDAG